MKKIYKIILIFNLQFSIFHLPSFSQITFQKTFGGTGSDNGNSVKQTTDGGFIIAGWTNSFSAGGPDVYLIKTNAYGDLLWTKTFGGGPGDYGYSVQQTTDDGYIISAYTNSFNSSETYLIKTDSIGDTLWTKTFSDINYYYFEGQSVQQTTDGGFIITGSNEYQLQDTVTSDVDLIKTDSNGNILWTKTFFGISAYNEDGYSVQQTTDGGYIVAGSTQNVITSNYDIYLIRTDANGDTLWTKTLGGMQYDRSFFVQQTTDGGYIITGYTNSFGAGGDDVYLIKADTNGNVLWSKTYGGINADWSYSVQQTTDGGYIITGFTGSFGTSTDVYLIKTDTNGNVLWSKTFGGTGWDVGISVQQTTDGGYIISGYTESFGTGGGDVYLIKTDSSGNSGCTEGNPVTIVTAPVTLVTNPATIVISPATIVTTPATLVGSGGNVTTLCASVGISNLQTSINSLQFFPNPLTTQSKLTFKNTNKEKFIFTLYDITGRITQTVSTTNNVIILTKGNKFAGVYIYNLTKEKTGERWNGKIVIGGE